MITYCCGWCQIDLQDTLDNYSGSGKERLVLRYSNSSDHETSKDGDLEQNFYRDVRNSDMTYGFTRFHFYQAAVFFFSFWGGTIFFICCICTYYSVREILVWNSLHSSFFMNVSLTGLKFGRRPFSFSVAFY